MHLPVLELSGDRGGRVKDRRYKACQHCCERVRLMPGGDEMDRLVDKKGSPQCVPGLLHKLMPIVGGEGETVG